MYNYKIEEIMKYHNLDSNRTTVALFKELEIYTMPEMLRSFVNFIYLKRDTIKGEWYIIADSLIEGITRDLAINNAIDLWYSFIDNSIIKRVGATNFYLTQKRPNYLYTSQQIKLINQWLDRLVGGIGAPLKRPIPFNIEQSSISVVRLNINRRIINILAKNEIYTIDDIRDNRHLIDNKKIKNLGRKSIEVIDKAYQKYIY